MNRKFAWTALYDSGAALHFRLRKKASQCTVKTSATFVVTLRLPRWNGNVRLASLVSLECMLRCCKRKWAHSECARQFTQRIARQFGLKNALIAIVRLCLLCESRSTCFWCHLHRSAGFLFAEFLQKFARFPSEIQTIKVNFMRIQKKRLCKTSPWVK